PRATPSSMKAGALESNPLRRYRRRAAHQEGTSRRTRPQGEGRRPVDVDLLDMLPQGRVDLNRLSEDQQRRIYDAFHLELRYNAPRRDVTIRVSITGETAPILGTTIETILDEDAQTQSRGPGRLPRTR